jgi:TonB family protein
MPLMTAWRFLFISLLVHLLIWLFLLNQPNFRFPGQGQSVEVSIIDKNNPKEGHQFAEAPKLDNLKPQIPMHPSVDAAQDQLVEKEMLARKNGVMKNGNSDFDSPIKRKQQQQSQNNSQKEEGDFGEKHNLDRFAPGPLTNSPEQPMNNMMSTNDIYRKDIATGPINSLNSERFTYYSFFGRVEEAIYPHWARNVESSMERLPAQQQKQLANHDLNTFLDIIIDAEGHYIESIVLQSSGVPEIDRAAIEAFASAKFFPNPPKEMVKADNKIHLKYQFTVQVGPAGWNRPSL